MPNLSNLKQELKHKLFQALEKHFGQEEVALAFIRNDIGSMENAVDDLLMYLVQSISALNKDKLK